MKKWKKFAAAHKCGLERIAVMAALNLAHDLIQTEQSAEQHSIASDVLQSMNSKIDSALFELITKISDRKSKKFLKTTYS